MFLMELYTRLSGRDGQTMAEYVLIVGAIAVFVLAAYTTLGGNLKTFMGSIVGDL